MNCGRQVELKSLLDCSSAFFEKD
ncbi:rCG63500 [Rattus norvegicus]|uniref:RCG63500 n=1 Tax=Rattus norvegicus TaxID=10116 RepID=A6HCT8_RAT|nr:rCG63500 [Rattus norvegicus]